jgi:tryptophan-rich sensory protein
VWTVLYILIGVAGWLIWREDRWGPPVGLWCVQLGLNALWSFLFFGLHRPGLAFIEIVLLWLAIGSTILAARRIDGLAALLLAPYWVWVTVAAVLNLSIWQMNP